jgi:hypothetical protein
VNVSRTTVEIRCSLPVTVPGTTYAVRIVDVFWPNQPGLATSRSLKTCC